MGTQAILKPRGQVVGTIAASTTRLRAIFARDILLYYPTYDPTRPIRTQKLRGQTRQGWREVRGQGIRGPCQAQDWSVERKGRCLLLGNFLARRTTRRHIGSNNKIHGGTCTGARTITELTIVETCEFSNSWLL